MLKRTVKFLPLALGLASAVASAQLAPVQYEPQGASFFFEGAIPKEVAATKGKLSLSSNVQKDGKQSLQWQFSPKATLTFTAPVKLTLNQAFPQSFMSWLYQDKALPGQFLTVNVKEKGKVVRSFKVELNFTGWYGLNVPYRDMPGQPLEQEVTYDQVEIVAPAVASTLYLDQVFMAAYVDNRWSVPDINVPFVNPKSQVAINKNWNALYTNAKLIDQHLGEVHNKVPLVDTVGSSAPIYEKVDLYNRVDPNLKVKPEEVQKFLEEYAQIGLKEEGNFIKGPTLTYPQYLEHIRNAMNFKPETRDDLMANTYDLRKLGQLQEKVARVLRSNNLEPEQRKALEDNFILATKYVFNQGFTYGNSYQVIHHVGYNNRELFTSFFIARHLLDKHGLLNQAQKTMSWYSGAGRILEEAVTDCNADILNTQLQWMLESILLIADANQREYLLAHFTDWLNKTILVQDGVGGGFKEDHTVFHHGQHYPAYGVDSFRGLTPTTYMLSGSKYALSKESHERYYGVLETLDFYTKNRNIPIALSVRHPTEQVKIVPDAYRWGAETGSVDKTQAVDEKLAGIFARVSNQKEYKGVPAAKEQTGVKALNYSSSLIARQQSTLEGMQDRSWLVLARGFSRYLPGNEAYEANNRYGRYGQYGRLEIIPADYDARSYRYEGYDMNHFDGATNIVVPFEKLKANLIQLPAAGIEEMLLSDQTYSGAVALDDKTGFFAQIVHGHPKYDQDTFWAKKSYFVIDNRVIAVGSDIKATDKDNPVQTTLFQHFTDPKNPLVTVNGKDVANGASLTVTDPVVLTTSAKVAYYVPGNHKVTVTNQEQTTPDGRNDKPLTNQFTTAVIDHGIAPSNASYNYSLIIEPKVNQAAPAYTIYAQDSRAHMVVDTATKTQAYALFEAGKVKANKEFSEQYLLEVSAPSMVLARATATGLDLSVVNPDLKLYTGVEADQVGPDGRQLEVSPYSRDWFYKPSQATTTSYTVKGVYKLAKAQPGVVVTTKDGNTVITVTVSGANVTKLELVK